MRRSPMFSKKIKERDLQGHGGLLEEERELEYR
jgi:hypothetical protein